MSDTLATTYAQWLVNHSRQRTLSPRSDLPLESYVGALLQYREKEAAKHVLRIDANNPQAIRQIQEAHRRR